MGPLESLVFFRAPTRQLFTYSNNNLRVIGHAPLTVRYSRDGVFFRPLLRAVLRTGFKGLG
jgi:hypothetical protein